MIFRTMDKIGRKGIPYNGQREQTQRTRLDALSFCL